VAASPVAASGNITFGCLNNPSKMSATALRLWAEILVACPGSRLLLLAAAHPQGPNHIHAFVERHGVAASRVDLVPPQPVAQYLALYHRVDIALDAYPCVGGTTTLDALWMGVPVVSLAGDRPFARSGASILHSVALDDLVAGSEQAYVAIACKLASDHERLVALRTSLRSTLAASALTDGERFARDMEAAFDAMHQRACASAHRAGA
jgi:predicted O-linked N-acetylglucosamine transferase (SPINDLY family)